MKRLLEKYSAKMVSAGLAQTGHPLLGGLDAELEWNREDPATPVLERVFSGLSINSLLFSLPAEPYRSIIDFLASGDVSCIRPEDSETRTFMHDLPVIRDFRSDKIIEKLRKRKSVIIKGKGIVTWGTVSPEQAFIFYSSVCFACFVKFFADYLRDKRRGEVSIEQESVFRIVLNNLDKYPNKPPLLMSGPFLNREDVYRAVAEAGRLTVKHRLVDSFFGNVSMRWGDTLFISQTTSSLDELGGCIDPCPLNGSACTSITASSEFSAHMGILRLTGMNAILHGHPKFSVIMSMDCRQENCDTRGSCHIRCPEERFIGDIPIVSGEVGTGPYGLCNTLPVAMEGNRGVIVWGHGLFTVSLDDFNGAFRNLLSIEKMCQEEYFRLLLT
ncbi:MAG: class II aldolase/adducin family protein [Candidatus Aegiribacteria sp.]|nr:class II aldolase/adducin family protein [Candidatus Aegiribacteria sp.]